MNTHQFIVGDIGFFTHTDNLIHPFKIIAITETDTLPTWHLMMYAPSPHVPTETDIPSLQIDTYHAPIRAFSDTAEFISHGEVAETDKIGYFEYLKKVDFRQYVAESGVDVQNLIAKAQGHYRNGYELTSQGRTDEAIAAYTSAIDAFPLLIEAFDNRAFIYMDRGDWKQAIDDFKQSIAVGPTFLAQFSLAECLCKSGNYAEAKAELEKAKLLGDDPHVAVLEAKINEALA